MARKPKAAAPKAAAPSTPTPAQQPVAAAPVAPQPVAVAAPATPAPAAATPSPATPAAAKAGEAASAPAAPAADAEQEQKIAALMDMGFPRSEVEAALRAAFNHAERAVEYLFNGIPANLASQAAAPAKAAGAPPKGTGTPASPAAPAQDPLAAVLAGNGPAPSSGQSDGPLSFLRSHPDFNAMKLAVQQNPQVLQQIMGALYQSNPQLVQLISQNQEEFTRLLEEPVDPEALARSQLLKRFNGDEDDEDDDASGAGGVPPGVIQVTPAEKEAIDRLEGMGFPRAKAIEAYFACDKNEELAANYLLEHGFDDQQ